MNKAQVIKKLVEFSRGLNLREEIYYSDKDIAEYLYASLLQLKMASCFKRLCTYNSDQEIFDEAEAPKSSPQKSSAGFVDRMYALYPTRCPKRNASLGKSHKDKVRIKRLLKEYSEAQIEQVIRHEVDANYGINYMKNFSTFLNNFPEPSNEGYTTKPTVSSGQVGDVVIINGVTYK